jgi:hypothetical protein
MYGWKDESIPIVDNTSHSSIPTKTQKVFQPLQVLSNTYYERMEPIKSSLFWPLDRTIYSWKYESRPIVDNTSRSSIPTKTQNVFQPLQVPSNTYYERMEPIQSSIVGSISSEIWPLDRTIYSWKHESSPKPILILGR